MPRMLSSSPQPLSAPRGSRWEPTATLAPGDLELLSRGAGLELGAYREEHVAERVRRALAREGLDDAAELARVLTRSERARSAFRRSVAVSVSGIFRDPGQFRLLEHDLLPALLADGRRLTVWSAGCADGSELVSVATILHRLGALERAHLLGSDLLAENIAVARRGRYADFAVPERVRLRLRWEQRDLTHEGPAPGPWRLILCRNLVIYLAPHAKARLYRALAGALARGGVLLLGRSERLSDPGSLGLLPAGPHAYRREGR